MLFTDESVFRISHADGRTRVLRRDPYGGGNIYGMAEISRNFKTDLVVINGTLTGQRHIDQVINPHDVSSIQRDGANFTFMDDNARPRRAIIQKSCPANRDSNIRLAISLPSMRLRGGHTSY